MLLSLHESTHTIRLKGSFSLRGDRPVDQDNSFKLSKLSLLGVPQKGIIAIWENHLKCFCPTYQIKKSYCAKCTPQVGCKVFFSSFFLPGCNFVLAHMHYISKNVTEMFDLCVNIESLHTRCLLEQEVEFFFHLIYIRCKTMDG